jgi:hypothetical protein
MLRRVTTTILLAAALSALGSEVRAATIGTFSLVDPDGDGDLFSLAIDVSNVSPAHKFTNLELGFCYSSVVGQGSVPPGFYASNGSILGCSQPLVAVPLPDGPVLAGGGPQSYSEFDVLPAFAFLAMKVWRVGDPTDGSVAPLDYFVDPLTFSCDPIVEDCTNFITVADGEVPIPEPATLLLLAGGLALAAGNLRRRSRG